MGSVAIIGTNPDLPVYVAIKGSVFDVSGNGSYAPKGAYHGSWRRHPLPTSVFTRHAETTVGMLVDLPFPIGNSFLVEDRRI